jgi:hypothetical protein
MICHSRYEPVILSAAEGFACESVCEVEGPHVGVNYPRLFREFSRRPCSIDAVSDFTSNSLYSTVTDFARFLG